MTDNPIDFTRIKHNDIFRFQWSPKKEHGWDSRYHCFQGTLRADRKRKKDGELCLIDTYWGIHGNGRVLTPVQISNEISNGGSFKYYCNLDEVDLIDDFDVCYYKNEDIYTISSQNACHPSCINHFLRRGATRDAQTMINYIKGEIENSQNDIRYAENNIRILTEKLHEVESGNVEVHL